MLGLVLRGPTDRINIRILRGMVSEIPLVLGRGTKVDELAGADLCLRMSSTRERKACLQQTCQPQRVQVP